MTCHCLLTIRHPKQIDEAAAAKAGITPDILKRTLAQLFSTLEQTQFVQREMKENEGQVERIIEIDATDLPLLMGVIEAASSLSPILSCTVTQLDAQLVPQRHKNNLLSRLEQWVKRNPEVVVAVGGLAVAGGIIGTTFYLTSRAAPEPLPPAKNLSRRKKKGLKP